MMEQPQPLQFIVGKLELQIIDLLTHTNNLQQLLEQQAAIIADLQNQQAAAATQNSVPTPALVLAPTSALRPPKVHIVKPPDFDSNNYDTFKQAIEFYLLAAR